MPLHVNTTRPLAALRGRVCGLFLQLCFSLAVRFLLRMLTVSRFLTVSLRVMPAIVKVFRSSPPCLPNISSLPTVAPWGFQALDFGQCAPPFKLHTLLKAVSDFSVNALCQQSETMENCF